MLVKTQNEIKVKTHARHTADHPRTARQTLHSAEDQSIVKIRDTRAEPVSHLASHQDERRGEPVVLEDLASRADEGEVEADWRCRSHVWS